MMEEGAQEEQNRPRGPAGDEEYEGEDGEEAPLCGVNEVATHMKLWAKSLRRPPRGHLKSFSEGIWRPELKACRVLKPKGNDMRSMGFASDGNVHLYPEETLFLFERCKLEVSNITTAQLYEEVDLPHYLTYAYFRQTSLVVFRVEDTCPVPIAFEAYAPCSQFSKKNRGKPILYVMYGRTRAPVPSDEELVEVFKWADGVPVKYAMVSDEGGVFAINLAPRPLVNQTPNQLKSRNRGRQNKRQKIDERGGQQEGKQEEATEEKPDQEQEEENGEDEAEEGREGEGAAEEEEEAAEEIGDDGKQEEESGESDRPPLWRRVVRVIGHRGDDE